MVVQLITLITILLIALFAGTPVMGAIGVTASIGMILFMGGAFWDQFGKIAYTSTMNNGFLISPLFLLMSEFLANGGVAEEIFAMFHKLLIKIKGGLAMATTLTCTIFAALCGSSPATAASVGVIATRSMTRRKYRKDFAIGTVAGAGTLGIMIPPSMTLVGFGILTGTSIAKLLMAGLIPGLMLSAMMIVSILIRSRVNPALVGELKESQLTSPKFDPDAYAVDIRAQADSEESGKSLWTLLRPVIPSLVLIVVVLGTMYTGITTPTEAAAIGAIGAFLIVLFQRKMNKGVFLTTMRGVARSSTMIIFMMVAGYSLTLVLSYLGIPSALAKSIASSGLNKYVVLTLVYILWFILGALMDPGSMVVLTVPFLWTTLTDGLGFDPVWIGVVATLMTEVGMISPPVGLNLFVLKATSGVEFKYILKGVWPYILVLLLGLVILTAFPGIALFLPNHM